MTRRPYRTQTRIDDPVSRHACRVLIGRLKDARLKHGVTQAVAADRLGIPAGSYRKIETGRMGFPAGRQAALLDLFPEASGWGLEAVRQEAWWSCSPKVLKCSASSRKRNK